MNKMDLKTFKQLLHQAHSVVAGLRDPYSRGWRAAIQEVKRLLDDVEKSRG